MGLRANTSDKNPKPICVIKRTSGLCEWLLQSVTQWLDQLDHQGSFVCVSISRITWINASVIHFFKQIAPNKCQAYRMKVLSFTLRFSYRQHYITLSDLVKFWIQILMKKLGFRILGPSLSSAVETSIKSLIFHHNQNHHYFGPLQALVIRWSYLGVRAYLQNLKFILKIWQTLKRIAHSGTVNAVIKTISLFLKKNLSVKKSKSSQNQPTKQKQANKKQQRLQFFAHKNF